MDDILDKKQMQLVLWRLWFYQLDGTKVRNWEELATAFYKQYQYNADLAD